MALSRTPSLPSFVGRSDISNVAPAFQSAFALLLAALAGHRDACAPPTAVDLLRRNDTDPDTREWAERYLCGMVDADPSRFKSRYPAQS